MINEYKCPVCDTLLLQTSISRKIQEVFDQWEPIHRFSSEVIEDHLLQSDETVLFRCPNCSLEIYLPQVIGSKQFYQELQDDPLTSYYREDKWDFIEAQKEVKKCQEILEIGCGPGSFLSMAKTKIQRVCGTEYNEAALKVAQEKGLEVYGLDFDMDQFRDHFDAIFSFHVLEHVANPLIFIKEISQYLKPKGKICISVPNHAGPLQYIQNSVMNMPPHHATHWELKTFKVLAKKLNYKILRVAYEPLLVENYNYYSYYWLEYTFKKNNSFYMFVKRYLSLFLENFFKLLMRLNIKYFRLLRGQAIYIVMQKK